jgi:hypothetical protein
MLIHESEELARRPTTLGHLALGPATTATTADILLRKACKRKGCRNRFPLRLDLGIRRIR